MPPQREDLEPEFLRMDSPRGTMPQPVDSDNGRSMGWPSRNHAQPKTVLDEQGRVTRVRTLVPLQLL
jgi:hypothetical protein